MRELFGSAAHVCLLCLALPQIWLWVMLRAMDGAATIGDPNLVFYLAEGATLAALALVLWRRPFPGGTPRVLESPSGEAPRPDVRASRVLAGAVAVPMALSPALVVAGQLFGVPALSVAFEIVGAACLVASYAAYFALCSLLPLRDAVSYLLLSFAVVPLVRLPLDMLPVEAASVCAAALPVLYALALGVARRIAASKPLAESGREAQPGVVAMTPASGVFGTGEGRLGFGLLLVELAAFGIAMGMFRDEAGGVYDALWFVPLNFVLKTAVPLLTLVAVSRLWQRVSVASLCQAALGLLTLLMVVSVNLEDIAAVPFVVFDLARYVMVVLIFLALAALARRSQRHPVVIFALGMGTYTLALGAGLALRTLLGGVEVSPSVLVLDVVCVLVLCTVLASGVGQADDVRLFADGSPELVPAQAPDEIDARCEAAGRTYALSERELDTMKLICRGRSKRYIAEQMALSENTVRGYAKTLYAKLDIHSRQELMTLVGVE